ncbi:MAG: 30S ribosome-binding factor RbfA [Chloroflexi bacterium]|nr:30S ribosome-binding factor RbfA [Chloroflexota bacterium]
MTRRTEKINAAIRADISDIIKRRIKDPRLGNLVSITEVITSGDLKHARVFISVLGSEEEKRGSLACLLSAAGFIRKELSERLTLRYVPELLFERDDSIEHGSHVLDIIMKLSDEEK